MRTESCCALALTIFDSLCFVFLFLAFLQKLVLISHTAGKAFDYIQTQDTHVKKDFDQLVRVLRARFLEERTDNRRLHAFRDLATLAQKGATLSEYFDRTREIMRWLPSDCEKELVKQLISGLDNQIVAGIVGGTIAGGQEYGFVV